MDADEHWAFARELTQGGPVDQARDGTSVKTLPSHDLLRRHGEGAGRSSARPRPGLQSASLHIQGVELIGRLRIVDRESQLRALAMEQRTGHAALGQGRQCVGLTGACIDHPQLIAAVHIDAQSHPGPIAGHTHPVYVPGNLRRHALQGATGHVPSHEFAELARAVTHHPQLAIVGGESHRPVGSHRGRSGSARHRQGLSNSPRGHIHPPHLGLIGRDVTLQGQLAIVVRDGRHGPARTVQLGDARLVVGTQGVDLPNLGRRGRLAGHTVQGYRGHQDGALPIHPPTELMSTLRRGEQGHLAGGQVQAKHLVGLIAPDSTLHDGIAAFLGLI